MTRGALAVLAGVALACSKTAAVPAPAAEAATAAAPAAGGAPAPAKLCEHRVPADLCTQCNPDLAPVFQAQGDWCEEHGVPESLCLKCHPDLTFTAAAAAPDDWCVEHGVPESKCTKCNPRLVARFVAAGDYCREHGFPESICPLCHPDRIPHGRAAPPFPTPGLKVRLASADTARDAGLETRRAETKPVARVLEVVGQLEFDQNRLAQLSARGDAVVESVKVDVGDDVTAGQPLVALTSASVGQDQARRAAAQAALDTARAAAAREEQLVESGASPRKNLEEARRALAAAQAELDAAGSALGAAGASPDGRGGRYVLRAPFAGTVVLRDAVAGRTVEAGQVLVQVADLSTMWAQLEVPEADAGLVRPGVPVELTFEGGGAPPRRAKIHRVAASVDPASRTVRVRVELPNGDRTLKAGTFLRAKIHVTAEKATLLVPREAVQRVAEGSLVFVKRSEQLYEPVAVKPGAVHGALVEITAGLEEGAEVVTTGAFLLKTEVMKESIGAGCCVLEEKE
ncbi:MAG TPA: efflux RND transporter periplasmic adaptor subunit [Anaeromyxobacter sp.]|nr:efflux RND transporter periplasmic adaptor subunit [Anaeromyxobacter sp.]